MHPTQSLRASKSSGLFTIVTTIFKSPKSFTSSNWIVISHCSNNQWSPRESWTLPLLMRLYIRIVVNMFSKENTIDPAYNEFGYEHPVNISGLQRSFAWVLSSKNGFMHKQHLYMRFVKTSFYILHPPFPSDKLDVLTKYFASYPKIFLIVSGTHCIPFKKTVELYLFCTWPVHHFRTNTADLIP